MTTILRARNVNRLYTDGLRLLRQYGVREESRAGPVLVMPYPVMSVYDRPTERVLFDDKRDANPFFHLYESLWMLAGRDEYASLNCYVKDFGERFGEPPNPFIRGGYIHGAYGRRWRGGFGEDQIDVIVSRLRSNPQDRQCVLQMWDARCGGRWEDGSSSGFDDLNSKWKDRPCNTHCYFRVRTEIEAVGASLAGGDRGTPEPVQYLDMTICCRSNDIVWGAYGANAVHFSMLQEYMAGRIGCRVGTMFQLSNNYHGYVDVLEKVGEPGEHHYMMTPQPIGEKWNRWDYDLLQFMEWHDHLWTLPGESNDIDLGIGDSIVNQWFYTTAQIMCQCNWLWKKGRKQEAQEHAQHIEADDWRVAAVDWMGRRMK